METVNWSSFSKKISAETERKNKTEMKKKRKTKKVVKTTSAGKVENMETDSMTHKHHLRPRNKKSRKMLQTLSDSNEKSVAYGSNKKRKAKSERKKPAKIAKIQQPTMNKIISPVIPAPAALAPEIKKIPEEEEKPPTKTEFTLLERMEMLEKTNEDLVQQLKTHTEAIQGLMQVVSTPQNLSNFQHQYAYQSIPSQPQPVQTVQAVQPVQQVQYMPVYAYPQNVMYYQPPQVVSVAGQPADGVTTIVDPMLKQPEVKTEEPDED